MKKIVPLFLTILMLFSTAVAENYTDICTILCNPEDMVNMRFHPSTKSEAVGRLFCGDKIETDGKTKKDKAGNVWVHIVNAGVEVDEAWVCSRYVQHSDVTIERCKVTITANGRTAIRRAPNGKRIKWAKNGDVLDAVAYSEEWVLTSKGYISFECVEVTYGD